MTALKEYTGTGIPQLQGVLNGTKEWSGSLL